MTHSPACTSLVTSFEGYRSHAYLDQRGIATLGYGRILDVHLGDTCTMDQALAWLNEDLATADAAVNRLVKPTLTQNQFDALVSFCFNLGQGNLAKSDLLGFINHTPPQFDLAAGQFTLWNKVRINGVLTPSDGLTRRRLAEQKMFRGEA